MHQALLLAFTLTVVLTFNVEEYEAIQKSSIQYLHTGKIELLLQSKISSVQHKSILIFLILKSTNCGNDDAGGLTTLISLKKGTPTEQQDTQSTPNRACNHITSVSTQTDILRNTRSYQILSQNVHKTQFIAV